MSSREDGDFLRDIQEAIGRVRDYIAGIPYDAFLSDRKTQDAVIRNLEIIGEAAKNVSEAFRAEHADLPWRGMAGIRDRLIHGYFGVNLDIVWNVATDELAALAARVEAILDNGGA